MQKNNNIALAELYYEAAARKDLAEMAKYLHPDVLFSTPLATLEGKEAVLEAAKGFVAFASLIKIRVSMSSENQVMLVYDVRFPDPIGKFPTASLLTFEDGQMKVMELFYDPRPLIAQQEKIFSK